MTMIDVGVGAPLAALHVALKVFSPAVHCWETFVHVAWYEEVLDGLGHRLRLLASAASRWLRPTVASAAAPRPLPSPCKTSRRDRVCPTLRTR